MLRLRFRNRWAAEIAFYSRFSIAATSFTCANVVPTEAAWLSLIEAQFGVVKRFALANTDDPSQVARRRSIYAYLRYRHRRRANLHLPLIRIHSFRPIKLQQHPQSPADSVGGAQTV
jgi:hypothetical protein